MAKELELILCEIYKNEANFVLKKLEWENVRLFFIPQTCHSPKIAKQVKEKIKKRFQQAERDVIFIGSKYGCLGCLFDEENESCENNISHTQCMQMISSTALIDFLVQQGEYILTPGWVDNWEKQLKNWGMDQNTARDMFHESIQKLVLLDTMLNKSSQEAIKSFSQYLDIPFETIPIGLEHFELYLSNIVSDWQNKQKLAQIERFAADRNQTLADYSMAMDMLKNLSALRDENSVIHEVTDLFTMLFSADQVTYLPKTENGLQNRGDHSMSEAEFKLLQDWAEQDGEDYLIHPYGNGFALKLTHIGSLLGILNIQEIRLPEHRPQYINLSLSIIHLCGLAILNARLYQQVHDLATKDELTKLYNRRHFYTLAEKELERSRRYQHPVSIMMLDIDHFKQINDSYGHLVGDQVLAFIAALIQKNKRKIDIAARYGGEEFVFLLPETGPEKAEAYANRLLEKIQNAAFEHDSEKISVTVSIGLTCSNGKANLNELLNQSDEALYKAKANGRNRVMVY